MIETREQWLLGGIAALRLVFRDCGHSIPTNVRVTCGWPSKSALARKKQRIGECWADTMSAGGQFEIFISPALADPARVLDTLAHELVHATVGLDKKHGKVFKHCATDIGLEGKMTSTHAGEKLATRLNAIANELGAYPHDELKPTATNGEKKQTARMIKCECACCGYVARTTAKWLEHGAPLCPDDTCDNYQEPMGIEQGAGE